MKERTNNEKREKKEIDNKNKFKFKFKIKKIKIKNISKSWMNLWSKTKIGIKLSCLFFSFCEPILVYKEC